MAHFEKYKISQVGGLLRHYFRTNENYSNDAIDRSKTALNYELCDDPIKSSTELKKGLIEACESLQGHLKSNAVAMVDLVITLPKDEIDEKSFFKACYEYLENRFPDVISASVHLDETTPHMHFAFAPITDDNRLCCKEILTRSMLRSFHQEMEKEVSKKLGHEVHLLNGATSQGHKSILELKNETLQKKYDELMEKWNDNYQKWQNQNKIIEEQKNEIKKNELEIKNLDLKYNEYKNSLDIKVESKLMSAVDIKSRVIKENENDEIEKLYNQVIEMYDNKKLSFGKKEFLKDWNEKIKFYPIKNQKIRLTNELHRFDYRPTNQVNTNKLTLH